MTRAALWTPGDTPQEGAKATGLYLPGLSTDNVTAPHSADMEIVGAVDIRVKFTDWVAITKGFSGTDEMWTLRATVGSTVQLRYYLDGQIVQVANSTVTLPLSPGELTWLRVVIVPDNGSNSTVTYYTSSDGELWTQLGSVIVKSAGIFRQTTTGIQLGRWQFTLNPGTLQRFELHNGIDGPIVAQWDGSVPHERQVDPQGNVWTVNGTANAWQEV